MNDTPDATSTRPYLIRALYEWCTDNGFTPYLAVSVDQGVQVPLEFVQNGEIVLNIGLDATSSLNLGNDYIEFKARFSGTAREIMVPVGQVMAIYARENGQGMSFPVMPSKSQATKSLLAQVTVHDAESATTGLQTSKPVQLSRVDANDQHAEVPESPISPRSPPGRGRPALKRVK